MHYLSSNKTKSLYKAVLSLKNEDECKRFLRDLLTEKEIKEFTNRWYVAQMLDRKIPYEKISKETNMSSTTIARIQKWVQKGMGGYKLMLKRLNKKLNHHTASSKGGVIF